MASLVDSVGPADITLEVDESNLDGETGDEAFTKVELQKHRKKRARKSKSEENIHSASEPMHENENQGGVEPQVCLIIREDKKAIPFNFINSCLTKWTVIQSLKQSSITRNAKGTVISAEIRNEDRVNFGNADRTFTHNNVRYEAFSPKQHFQYIGEHRSNL